MSEQQREQRRAYAVKRFREIAGEIEAGQYDPGDRQGDGGIFSEALLAAGNALEPEWNLPEQDAKRIKEAIYTAREEVFERLLGAYRPPEEDQSAVVLLLRATLEQFERAIFDHTGLDRVS